MKKFLAYDPYSTYSGTQKHFVNATGEATSSNLGNSAADEEVIDLWRLGRSAFDPLRDTIDSTQDFSEFSLRCWDFMQGVRGALHEGAVEKNWLFQNVDEETCDRPDFDDLSDLTILNILWKIPANSENHRTLLPLYLHACLEEIDNALVAFYLGQSGLTPALAAAEAYSNYLAIDTGSEQLQSVRREMGVKAAMERYRNDPKQKAKAFIKECWNDWLQTPSRYKTQSAFAQDVIAKLEPGPDGESLISFDTVLKKWIPSWRKESK